MPNKHNHKQSSPPILFTFCLVLVPVPNKTIDFLVKPCAQDLLGTKTRQNLNKLESMSEDFRQIHVDLS